jgi:hypothetical protein
VLDSRSSTTLCTSFVAKCRSSALCVILLLLGSVTNYVYPHIQSTKDTEIKYIWYIIQGHRGVGQGEGVGKRSERGRCGPITYQVDSVPPMLALSLLMIDLSSVYFTLLHLFQVDSSGVQVTNMDSRWTPSGVYIINHICYYITWTPPGLHLEFTKIPDGLHLEFR